MNFTSRRIAASLGATVIAGSLLLAPAAASAAPSGTPALAHDDAPHCQVESGALGWGMKQSFREYITGSIAHGSWQTDGGAEYIAPKLSSTGAVEAGTDLFEWNTATGDFEGDLSAGTLAFTGGVHFSGHDGGMELNIANPTIEFEGADTAYLLLEIGEQPLGEPGTQVRAAKLDLAGVVNASGEQLSITGAPVRLTAEGSAGFNGESGRGTYVAGQEMDPLYLNATVTGCALGEVVADEQAPSESAEDTSETVTATPISATEDTPVPWVPIIIGGVALVVIIAAAGMLLAGRKKAPQAGSPVDPQAPNGGGAEA